MRSVIPSLDASTGDYLAPTGIHDSLVATWDTSGNPTTFALTTKSGMTYHFSGGTGNRWNCVSITDRNSNTITISHNSGDFVTAVTDPSGRALTFTYNSSNKLTEVDDPLGRSFLLSYNTGGDLYQVVYPSAVPASGLNPTVSLAYNTNHDVTTLTDARSQNWTFTYSSNNALLTATDPLSHTTTTTFNSLNEPLTVTTPGSRVTTYR